MDEAPLYTLQDARLSFGGTPLFDGLDLYVKKGDKICLVGRNGSGKSTLLKVVAGLQDVDAGTVFVQPGTRIAYMAQETVFAGAETLRDAVIGGLRDKSETYKADLLIDKFALRGAADAASASGGERKKAALAAALAGEPDILLLDEPTNHMDIESILRLEKIIAGFVGAVIVISHDRTFLKNVSTATVWIDRGRTHEQNKGFADFEDWRDKILEQEESERENLARKIARETVWLHKGVTARRKRNMGRLRRLQDLRQERREQIKQAGSVSLTVDQGEIQTNLIIEAKHLNKTFDGREIVKDFSFRLMRGNKIGVVGPNGAGKTTLVKLMTGKMKPDSGFLRLTRNLQEAYFDQNRMTLDETKTLKQTLCPDGGDTVFVRGEPRHVVSYLKDYLFSPLQLNTPVSALSGGEKNRLMLARALAKPSNFLVLDEPTNDLDTDTLDLLQDALAAYEGTMLVVSHDRDFLDNVATSLLYMKGDGTVFEYVGGYTDLIARLTAEAEAEKIKKEKARPAPKREKPSDGKTRMSYKDKRELEMLPAQIDALTEQIAALESKMNDGGFYARDPTAFARTADELERLKAELDGKETRWLELSETADALS